MNGWCKDSLFVFASFFISLVLGIILIYQSILVCGSVAIIKVANYSEPTLVEMVNQYSDNTERVMSPEESDRIIKDFALKNPLVAHYIDGGEFEGYTAKELPHAIISELKSYMGWFIFRRILWSLGLTILSAVLVIKTMSRQFVTHDRIDRNRQPATRTEQTLVHSRRR